MRIAFAGASGTGKSTLANFLAKEYGLPVNPVGSRSVSAAMGFASPYDVDRAGKRSEFQQRLLDEKLAWERDHEAFVTDRTTLDNLAYTTLHDVHSIDAATLTQATQGAARPPRGGNGLWNMRQRLVDVGGQCVISSQPGHGSTVSLSVPLGGANQSFL